MKKEHNLEDKEKALHIADVIRTYNRRFKLYLKVESDMKSYEMSRGSRFGIATSDDEYAIKWRGLQMRRELLKSYLEGSNPNWWFADYLPREERDRRNQTYCV